MWPALAGGFPATDATDVPEQFLGGVPVLVSPWEFFSRTVIPGCGLRLGELWFANRVLVAECKSTVTLTLFNISYAGKTFPMKEEMFLLS